MRIVVADTETTGLEPSESAALGERGSFCVYKITNTITNDSYVGCTTVGVRRRFDQHMRATSAKHFTFAVRKYGAENFSLSVLKAYSDKQQMLQGEIRWIAELKPTYNLTLGGDGLYGFTHTDSTRAKISAANSGERHWAYGKKLNEETRALPRQNNFMRGRKLTQEQIELRRHRARGNKANLGRKLTEEHKAKIAASKTGQRLSPETIEKIRAARLRIIALQRETELCSCAS